MTRLQRTIVESWSKVLCRAIAIGTPDDAYRLTVGCVRRLRELGIVSGASGDGA